MRCKRSLYNCKEQLLIEENVIENCKFKHRSLSTVWIEYEKAFYTVPQASIIKVLEIYKLVPTHVNFLKLIMNSWRTTLILYYAQGHTISPDINIASNIFQGDS